MNLSHATLYLKIVDHLSKELLRVKGKMILSAIISLFFILFFFPFVFAGFGLVILGILSGITGGYLIFFILIFVGAILGFPLWYLLYQIYIFRATSRELREIQKINSTFNETFHTKETIDEIINQIGKIGGAMKNIQLKKKSKRTKPSMENETYHENQVLFFIAVLYNLRSDLISNLSEQKNILKSAKSEVETNIQGTSELANVSEVQKIRLDRQIEQFEELQRVLVKA